MSSKSIYIHLPFCKTKCPYCDFASFADHDRDKHQEYIDALCNEINLRLANYKPESRLIETIFFGGGTPSVHSQEQIKQIIDTLKRYFHFSDSVEITLEANPGTIEATKLAQFKAAGINRISIGAQTFDENFLQKLGRGHSVQDTYKAIADIKSVDFNSWSFDLIYGLPGQDLKSWSKTLELAMSFAAPHISAYALSIEEKTPYGAIYKNSYHPDLPDEERVVEMYELANKIFANYDLERYEISNWAKPGHEAKHNLTYWKAAEYYAFGLSAHGYIEATRYKNTRDLKNYLNLFSNSLPNSLGGFDFSFSEENILIEEATKLEETILLGLRLSSGIKLSPELQKLLNVSQLSKYVENGFLELENHHLKLTDRALMLSNRIIGDLLS